MTVLFNIEDQIVRVTIDRPDRLNAVDADTELRLEEIWQQIESDPTIRCVVLTGSGDRAFSAGADLKSQSDKTGVDYWVTANPNGFGGIALRESPSVPVIGRVNGLALGGGMEMVLGCDIVVAADHAAFALPEARVGRMPLGGGLVRLPRLIPEKIALGLMLTGRRLSCEQAVNLGFVNTAVSANRLDDEVEQWVNDIKACSPMALRAIKKSVHQTQQTRMADAYALKLPEILDALNSEDAQEGVAAFREKRRPIWTGK